MSIKEITNKLFDRFDEMCNSAYRFISSRAEYRSRVIRAHPGGLEDLLKELSSVEGVSNAVRHAVDLGLTTRPDHLKLAIKVYERENDFCGALELARTAKSEYEKQSSSEVSATYSNSAANTCHCMRCSQAKAAEYEKQADAIYEKGLAFYKAHKDFWGVAVMAEDAGHYDVAMEYYEKAGEFRNAGRMANKLVNQKTAKAYEIPEVINADRLNEAELFWKKAKAYETLADLLG